MRVSTLALGAALFGGAAVMAQSSDQPTCGVDQKCPEYAPCCSMYGQCGVGAYCLGGCDPRSSFSIDSCMPAPVCEDRKMKMNSLDRIKDISKYLGDPSEADWVSQGEPVITQGNVLLTMPKGSVGTVLSSTVYMWYGSVKARMRTSRGRGVITAFILFSDVQDEIDYEWVGVDLETSQTNYYFQGIPDYEQSKNISVSDSFRNWHEYEIKWTPDEISWIVDGEVERVRKRADTWNATSQNFAYPQTPSRVMFSVWPGGLESNAEGTINWAGGLMDWEHPDITESPGYFYAAVSDVEMKCYNADSAPGTNSGRSYTYTSTRGTNDTVVDGDERTTLKSLLGTGLDRDRGEDDDDDDDEPTSTKSGSSATATPTRRPNTIPGGGSDPGTTVPGSDEGNNSNNDNSSGGGSGGNGGNGGNGGGSGGGDMGSGGNGNCDPRQFSQDEDACGSGGEAAGSDDAPSAGSWGQEKTTGASAFAALVAVAGLFFI